MTELDSYTVLRIRAAGERMQGALKRVFESVPSQAHRPGGLNRLFGIQKDASGFLFNAYKADNPLVVVSHLPGTASLSAICGRLEDSGRVPAAVTRELRESIEYFDSAVKDVAGERAVLDEMISFWIPDVRRDVERRALMTLYRSARAIQGNSARHAASVRMYAPGESSEDLRLAHGAAVLGMRRFSLGVDFNVSYGYHWGQGGEVIPFEGVREVDVAGFGGDQVLRTEPVHGAPYPDRSVVPMGNPAAGKPLVRDMAMARTGILRGARPVMEAGDLFAESLLGTPTEHVVSDYLVHRDIELDRPPEVFFLDYMTSSRMSKTSPRTQLPRVPVAVHIQELRIELLERDAGEFPRYGEFVEHLASDLSSRLEDYRLFRVALEYPPYGGCLRVYL